MGIRARFQEWRKLAELRRDEERVRVSGMKKVEAAKSKGAKADQLNEISDQSYWEASLFRDQIDEILTLRLMRKARQRGVPIPQIEEGSTWTRSSQLGTWSLTEEGAMKLRREIATEVDIAKKPWLNWGALVISLFSLVVSIVALTPPAPSITEAEMTKTEGSGRRSDGGRPGHDQR